MFSAESAGDFLACLCSLDQIRQMQRAGKSSGPAADDQNIRFELFPLGVHCRISRKPSFSACKLSLNKYCFTCGSKIPHVWF